MNQLCQVSTADAVTVTQVRCFFRLRRPPEISLSRVLLADQLREAGLLEVDLVLCLLRLNTPDSLAVCERVVGRPITRCPAALRRWRRPPVRVRGADDRLVVRVSADRGPACLLSSDLYRRLDVARVGMSVAQLLARGCRRRDVLIATRRGYFVLEDEG